MKYLLFWNQNQIMTCLKKIIRERYSLLVASSNEKILLYDMCKKGVKSDFFINFINTLKKWILKMKNITY
jgi:hypothetical protein